MQVRINVPCHRREVVRLEERYSTLLAASEAALKEAQTASLKAQEELAAAHEQHEKVLSDAAAAREASVATVRTERNSALKELREQHASELARAKVCASIDVLFGTLSTPRILCRWCHCLFDTSSAAREARSATLFSSHGGVVDATAA